MAPNHESIRIIRNHVRKEEYSSVVFNEPWRNLPEIPSAAEICPPKKNEDEVEEEEEWNAYMTDPIYDPDLPTNPIDRPWDSKISYIGAHYQILREDAISPLRRAVAAVQRNPEMMDDDEVCQYIHVHFVGLQLSPLGPAFRVEFSSDRAGKQIRWEQSKRLMRGTIVALTPERDMFRTTCKIAIVAGRQLAGGLDLNPPQIDLFWGIASEAVFDPVEPYVMVEARSGYFESHRHMLVALQKLATESFPLSKYLVEIDQRVEPPEYLKMCPSINLSPLLFQSAGEAGELGPNTTLEDAEALAHVNILKKFPKIPNSTMDDSQLGALERMLTKSVAIVQGPPGTGKTFVSVSALKVMLQNTDHSDGPILVAAQTNHALDLLLSHCAKFCPDFVRLGGRFDRGNLEIRKRSLFELRTNTPNFRGHSWGVYKDMKSRSVEIQKDLAPLFLEEMLMGETLLAEGIITQDQYDSLHEEGWIMNGSSSKSNARGPIAAWLGDGEIIPIPRTPPVNTGLELEDNELDFEQLKDAEFPDDQDQDGLTGVFVPFKRQFTGRHSAGVNEKKVKRILEKNENLYDINVGMRGDIYRYWERQLDRKMLQKLRERMTSYKETVESVRIVKWDNSVKLLQHLGVKLIGCTTTGLSKYRGMIAAMKPRILLIEEAAETLEAMVMAGMLESLEHLVLVGDHRQLQAHCNVRALESQPYNMAISMFERLVNNGIGYTMLNKQRRMIPEIRELLCVDPDPFYTDLFDHPSVLDRVHNRQPIPGMNVDSWFFHHNWPEKRSPDLSVINQDEAQMIAGFVTYLVLNGTELSRITILTFYNGQRKMILKELRKSHVLGGYTTYFNVFTVDSYQGEENDIILLSMVRSNTSQNIGFLENRNRLVVALSRARRGLYIFGNAVTLKGSETTKEKLGRDPLWGPILQFIVKKGKLHLDGGLPVTCMNHGTTTVIFEADDWTRYSGGCSEPCGEILPACGHVCANRCHPVDHDQINCLEACLKVLPCGHGCSRTCGERCYCMACELALRENPRPNRTKASSLVSGWEESPPKAAYRDARITSDSEYESSPRKSVKFRDVRPVSGPLRRHETSTSGTGGSSPSKSVQSQGGRSGTEYGTNRFSQTAGNYIFPPRNERASSSAGSSPNKGLNSRGLIKNASEFQSSPAKWNAWDAKKADKQMDDMRREIEAKTPKLDLSKAVFRENFHSVSVTDGGKRVRDESGPVERIISRHQLPSPIPASKSKETVVEGVTNDFAKHSPFASSVINNIFGEGPQSLVNISPAHNSGAKAPKLAGSVDSKHGGILNGNSRGDDTLATNNVIGKEEQQELISFDSSDSGTPVGNLADLLDLDFAISNPASSVYGTNDFDIFESLIGR